jgi:N-acetylmuramoyl-L-alanine amidase
MHPAPEPLAVAREQEIAVTDRYRTPGGHACRNIVKVLAPAVTAGLAVSACGFSGGFAAPTHPATTKAAASPRPTARPATSGSGGAAGGAPKARLLAGKVVGIDPGHNGLNNTDAAYIDRQIWNGRALENCDTTGTETDGGYTEAQFNFNVATYLRADLRHEGAHVVMTRQNNQGVGPCVDRRAQILNLARANVAIDIHADGGPSWGRGFTVLEPVADGPNNKVIATSEQFGRDVHSAFLAHTPMPISNYYGHDGYIFRSDLAGLNLTTVPKVLIESGNMRNAADAALLTSPSAQRRIAQALEAAINRFLTRR